MDRCRSRLPKSGNSTNSPGQTASAKFGVQLKTKNRLLVRLSRTNFSPERCGRPGVDHHEVHAQSLGAFFTVLQPVNRPVKITALVAGLGGLANSSAQSFSAFQSGRPGQASLVHIGYHQSSRVTASWSPASCRPPFSSAARNDAQRRLPRPQVQASTSPRRTDS